MIPEGSIVETYNLTRNGIYDRCVGLPYMYLNRDLCYEISRILMF